MGPMTRLLLRTAATVAMVVTAASTLGAEAASDPKLTKPLPVGTRLPAFAVRDVHGAAVEFSPDSLASPVVLIFYRGGWCPYCNAHLAELVTAEERLLEMGFRVIFLSADRPEMLRSSLKEPDIRYTLLSDSRMEAARALGIAFRVDDATVEKYKSHGIDLERASGETHHELPVPAVFLADRSGVLRFVHANPDYKVRIKSAELLAAAQRVVGQIGGSQRE